MELSPTSAGRDSSSFPFGPATVNVHSNPSTRPVSQSKTISTDTELETEKEKEKEKEKEARQSARFLQFPTVCHDPSISPLPPPTTVDPADFPVAVGSRFGTGVRGSTFGRGGGAASTAGGGGGSRFSTMSTTSSVLRRKWKRKTRIGLHVVHWLAFIAVNIPSFVNIGLVPAWYNPPPDPDTTTGVNSPHRLAGLCRWSPDVIWAGAARPPSYPPGCPHTVSYEAWLWGSIGRALLVFFLMGLWIVFDGVWWGAWVVGTRNIGWKGAFGRPWTSRLRAIAAVRRQRRQRDRQRVQELDAMRRNGDGGQQQEGEEHAYADGDWEGTGESEGERRESAFIRRIRLLSATSKASAKSGKSGRSGKSGKESEKGVGAVTSVPPLPHPDTIAAAIPPPTGVPIGGIGIATPSGSSTEDVLAISPVSRHRVRRKPVRPVSFPSPSDMDAVSPGAYSLNSPLAADYTYRSEMAKHTAAITAASRATSISTMQDDTEGNSGDDDYEDAREELSGGSSPRTYPERPPSRLARYDDASIFGGGSTYGGNQDGTPPSPEFSLRQRGQAEPGWTDDLVSPDADAPLLSHQSYFMVGDGGFSTGGNGTTTNEGAYDEESYYRAVSYPRVAVAEADRASSPNSERSASPLSYGHGQIGRILPDEERQQQQQQQQQQQHLSPPSTSQTQRPYQHPLAQGIQMAMGRSTIEPPDREIRMLGGVVRRMSTIESFGSHERDLSRRGSAATARTTYTNTRGNSGGNGGVGSSAMVARENTNGSGNSIGAVSVLIGSGSGGGGSGDGGSGSAGQIERTREAEEVGPIVRSSSPTDLSQR
ncbi:hypothetical protein FRB91_000520 [Serendipita sp. 411]|nr:hypothetical protein FRB91_000520 [Serendipita sp. 411]